MCKMSHCTLGRHLGGDQEPVRRTVWGQRRVVAHDFLMHHVMSLGTLGL